MNAYKITQTECLIYKKSSLCNIKRNIFEYCMIKIKNDCYHQRNHNVNKKLCPPHKQILYRKTIYFVPYYYIYFVHYYYINHTHYITYQFVHIAL